VRRAIAGHARRLLGCPPTGLVFSGPGGSHGVPRGARTQLSVGNLRRVYKRTADRAELAHLLHKGPHDFRHTLATWLEDTGIPSRVIDHLLTTARPELRRIAAARWACLPAHDRRAAGLGHHGARRPPGRRARWSVWTRRGPRRQRRAAAIQRRHGHERVTCTFRGVELEGFEPSASCMPSRHPTTRPAVTTHGRRCVIVEDRQLSAWKVHPDGSLILCGVYRWVQVLTEPVCCASAAPARPTVGRHCRPASELLFRWSAGRRASGG
jgi:hypothetical protein